MSLLSLEWVSWNHRCLCLMMLLSISAPGKRTFGKTSCTIKLLCRWHLDKNWRRAIKDKVEEKELQPEIYRHLIVLLQESELIEFNKKLQQFLTLLTDNGMDEFLIYILSGKLLHKD